jgi:hypothetical protein
MVDNRIFNFYPVIEMVLNRSLNISLTPNFIKSPAKIQQMPPPFCPERTTQLERSGARKESLTTPTKNAW